VPMTLMLTLLVVLSFGLSLAVSRVLLTLVFAGMSVRRDVDELFVETRAS